MTTIQITLKNPETQTMEQRRFSVVSGAYGSGYVYDTTDRPGTLGRQVSNCLTYSGNMMECASNAAALREAILRAQRRRLRRFRELADV